MAIAIVMAIHHQNFARHIFWGALVVACDSGESLVTRAVELPCSGALQLRTGSRGWFFRVLAALEVVRRGVGKACLGRSASEEHGTSIRWWVWYLDVPGILVIETDLHKQSLQ